MSENDIKPVAWCAVDDMRNEWAFAWGGTGRRPWHDSPLYDQSAIDALTNQIRELKTMLSIAEFQRKEMQAERDAAEAERDALSTMLAVAGGRLEEAANEIEDWGAYADEYFQKKHLLAEVVKSFRDDAKDAADAARAEGE